MEELEAMKQELMESQDKTQANVELRTEREKQYQLIKVCSLIWSKSLILSETSCMIAGSMYETVASHF